MIDVRRLRDELDSVRRALARRGIDLSELDRAADLDRRHRALVMRRDELRGRKNTVSKDIGAARRAGEADRAFALTGESTAVGEELDQVEAATVAAERELSGLLLRIPNLPADDAPDGASEADNPVLRVVGFGEGEGEGGGGGSGEGGGGGPAGYAEHQRVPHWEIGAALGILDLERGARISGSMFPVYRGMGATLARALCQLALDRNADAFEEIRPPTLVRTETLQATGQLPKFADDAYHIERDDLWLIPTAEVPLTSLRRNEILGEAELPVRLMGCTPCYRREAGSAGRDTRGLLRVHEFDKVEILAITTPAQAADMHAELLARAEGTIAALGLAYRIVDISTGDLGQSHARSFDIEVYAPGCGMWLEVSSVSWFSDYQARRANIRYRPVAGGQTVMCHTLNGSALAVPRVWAALVETGRQPDGSVDLPPVLHPYLRGATGIPARS
ncbi:MAG: seryl-tRNA synthetase [Acidimicrobiaceae bacterium]|jgi:seryl-tRNA synthetase|nr:seryl-tRNA synthetase [Acidimicrobiaceae bacterium]